MDVAILGIKTLPAVAGADRVVERLLENLPRDSEYHVYLLRKGPFLRDRDNLHYVYLPAPPGKHLRPFSYFLFCALHFLFARRRYQIAHVHNSDFGLFCALLRLRSGIRIVGTFHGDPYLRTKWGFLARTFLRFSERVFVQFCDTLTSVAASRRTGRAILGEKPVRHIPNGIDRYWDRQVESRFDYELMGLVRGRYLMFACGRLDSTKGLHHLLAAYRAGRFEERLLVVGDFGHDPAYSRAIEEACAGDPRIALHASLLDRDTLIDVLRNCKVFVFPSEVEAMSMMLLEAISCRRLVVSSDIPENADVVGESYPYAFSLSTPGDLERKLAAALRDPRAEAIAERLHAACMERFSWRAIGDEYGRLYAGISGGG